jgi:uncharacterized membrane protein YoaK (UPF0700 family)
LNRSGLNHVAWSTAGANSPADGSNRHTGNHSHPAIAARLLDRGAAGYQVTGHGADDTSVDSTTNKATQRRLVTPAFEHLAFPVVLGFVAGFVDIFGFMALFGLLPAHVTGNLIFIAVDIARQQYNLIMKIAALPIFAASVAISAWLIAALSARRREPFLPVVLLQAAILSLSLIAGLLMPPATSPDDSTVALVGSTMLFAMAVQNTMMRLILNNLPPTTIMTGNITYMVAEGMRLAAGFGTAGTQSEASMLARRAQRIGLALASFTAGAIIGGLAQRHVGYVGLLMPIAALLILIPIRRNEMRRCRVLSQSLPPRPELRPITSLKNRSWA